MENQVSLNTAEQAHSTTQPNSRDQVADDSNEKALSFARQVSALAVGECVGKVVPIINPQFFQNGVLEPELNSVTPLADIKRAIRNNVGPAIRAAIKRTGGQYASEVDHMLTGKGSFYIVAVITRTA